MASACGTGQSESRRFCALHGFNYTTRANISHEKAEQIRARIACTPAEKWVAGVNLASALTEVTISLLQWEKVARFTATDEVLSYMYYQNKPHLAMFAHRRAPKSEPRGSP